MDNHAIAPREKQRYLFLLIFFVTLFVSPQLAKAENNLISRWSKGEVHLLDSQGEITPITDNLVINTDRFPFIELGNDSQTLLEVTGKTARHFSLMGEKRYSTKELLSKQVKTITGGLLKTIARFIAPRRWEGSNLVKGSDTSVKLEDGPHYQQFWETLIRSESRKNILETIVPDRYLAASVWYFQKERFDRAAYILEQLSNIYPNNTFYGQLRKEALEKTSYFEISKEIKRSRKKIQTTFPKLRNIALLIGNNEYQHPDWTQLENPIRDVLDLKAVLIEQYGFYEEDVLVRTNATEKEIYNAYKELKYHSSEESNVLIFYSGHGQYLDNQAYWVPVDANGKEAEHTFISSSQIRKKIESLNARHVLLISDSCFSGDLVRKSKGGNRYDLELSRHDQFLIENPSRHVLTSSRFNQPAYEGKNNSVFTRHLLKILRQERSNPISSTELFHELRNNMIDAGEEQTPQYSSLKSKGSLPDEEGDFLLIQQKKTNYKPKKIIKTRHEGGLVFRKMDLRFEEKSNKDISIRLTGVGVSWKHLWKGEKYDYGVHFQLGQYQHATSGLLEYEQGEMKIRSEETNSVNGTFIHVGWIINLLSDFYFLNVEMAYERDTLDDEENYLIESINGCLHIGIQHETENWFFRYLELGTCEPFLFQNVSPDMNTEEIKNFRKELSQYFGISFGTTF